MRIEIVLRDQVSRKHIQTITVEVKKTKEILSLLDPIRQPVLNDIQARLIQALENKNITFLKKNTDFFDSKGNDITDKEFYLNEILFD